MRAGFALPTPAAPPCRKLRRVAANLKPVYLIHGTEHGRIAERRARLRALGEAEGGVGNVEVFEGESCTPEAVVGALSALTFSVGRRFLIFDGVQRFKEADATTVAEALAAVDPAELVVAFFAREEGRAKVPKGLHKAVKAAGGQIVDLAGYRQP